MEIDPEVKNNCKQRIAITRSNKSALTAIRKR